MEDVSSTWTWVVRWHTVVVISTTWMRGPIIEMTWVRRGIVIISLSR